MIDQENFFEISVVDTGSGIHEKDIDKLFKIFGYIQSSGQKNIHGIGLGLNLSQRIMK